MMHLTLQHDFEYGLLGQMGCADHGSGAQITFMITHTLARTIRSTKRLIGSLAQLNQIILPEDLVALTIGN